MSPEANYHSSEKNPENPKYQDQLLREVVKLKAQLAVKDQMCREMSEQLDQLKAKKSNKETYPRGLLDSMREGFVLVEPLFDEAGDPYDYRLLEANEAAGRILAIDPEAEKGKTALQVFPNFDPEWLEIFRKVVLSREPAHFEKYSHILNKWFSVCAFSPDHGQFAWMLIDITQRIQSEQKLLESEHRFKRSQEIAHLGSWELDLTTRELTWSDEVFRIFGLEPQELEPNYDAILEFVHPEDRAAVDAAYSNSIRKGIDTYEIEHRIVRKDTAEIRQVLEKCHHRRDAANGRITGSLGMVLDITERKQFEEQLQRSRQNLKVELDSTRRLHQISTILIQADDIQTLYEQILDTAMAIMHADFASIQMFNPERGPNGELRLLGCRGFNRQAAEFWQWIHPESCAPAATAFRTGKRVIVSDVQTCDFMAGSDDQKICLGTGIRAGQTTPLLSRAGAVIGALSTHWRQPHEPNANELRNLDVLARQAADLIDRRQAEESLRKMNETLEQQVAERTMLAEARYKQLQALAVELIEAEERERERIAQILHEDLQQTLAAARFQLQASGRNLLTDPALATVEQLIDESIAKSRSLSQDLSPPVLSHLGVVTSLKWLAKQMSEKYGLQVQLEADEVPHLKSPPLQVFIFRSVQEFLFNVVKHAGINSARVVLSRSGGDLAIKVSDGGSGFDPAILDSAPKSAGLGLMSLRERANFLGGGLAIKSAPGKGSCLILRMPLNLDGGQTSIEQHLAPSDCTDRHDRQKTRILFADDHKVMRQGLIRLIEGQPDIEVVGEASNGLEAIELARRLKPDVIVMDVSMPKMDGIEATRRIKDEIHEVRIIGLSMFDDRHTAEMMHKAGAEAFVRKTASMTEFLDAIYGNAGIGQ